jgi:hypothetical protein
MVLWCRIADHVNGVLLNRLVFRLELAAITIGLMATLGAEVVSAVPTRIARTRLSGIQTSAFPCLSSDDAAAESSFVVTVASTQVWLATWRTAPAMPDAATMRRVGRWAHELVGEGFGFRLAAAAAGAADGDPPGEVVTTMTMATAATSRTIAAETHHRRLFGGAA